MTSGRGRTKRATDSATVPGAARRCRPVVRAVFVTVAAALGLPATLRADNPPAPDAPAGEIRPEDAEFFEKQIRPLLAEHCQKCHSGEKPKGGLRLDTRQGLLKGGDSGPAFAPGEPEALIVDAVRYTDPLLKMPPKGKLADEQIALIERWTALGAPWPAEREVRGTGAENAADLRAAAAAHWSFRPLRGAVPPIPANDAWCRDPLDRFILERLEEEGLSPAAEADRRVWIRRVTFGLIGLPPSLREIHNFLEDDRPDAYERVVDRLLSSPHYGERWARHWLDLVRFAETYGHEFDFEIPHAAGYRDYVVRAFNDDLPYHVFAREHVAGDLLAEPRRNRAGDNESILATGFWFLHEGKHSPVDVREEEASQIDNQIDVFAKTFCGLTLGCARCHDHKFDPLTQRDYYALAGFLQSSRYQHAFIESEASWRDRLRPLRQLDDEARSGLSAQILERIPRQVARKLAAGSRDEILESAARDPGSPWHVWSVMRRAQAAEPDEFRRKLALVLEELSSEEPRANTAAEAAAVGEYVLPPLTDAGWTVSGPAFPTKFVDPAAALQRTALGRSGPAAGGAETIDSAAVSARLHGAVRSPTFLLSAPRVHLRLAGAGCRVRLVIDGFQLIRNPIYGGLEFSPASTDRFVWQAIDVTMWQGHRAYLELLDEGDGWFALSGACVGEPPASAARPNAWLLERLKQSAASTIDELAAAYASAADAALRRLLDRTDGSATAGGPAADDEARFAAEAVQLAGGVSALDEGGAARAADYRKAREELEAALPQPRMALAIADGTAEDERLFIRGNHKNLGPVVPRRFIEVLQPAESEPVASAGSGRLVLADRLTSPDNPLFDRVIVNRIWHHHFGIGIVPTTDDFGAMGQPPTHPELLDWLATTFRAEGRSLKALHKRIVLSSTYRQTSAADPAAEKVDPRNRLYHHFPVRRLEAEAVRDALLAVSGRLDRQMYGRGPLPHLTPFMQGRGRPQSGPLDGDGRRSLYLNVRRNFLTPMFLAFDYPTPFTTIGRRTVSNVPAQAMVMLNNPFVMQQAEVWAQRELLADPDAGPAGGAADRARVARMYETALARLPTEEELQAAFEFLESQRPEYGPAESWRAWADLAHVLFNVKEFIYLR